MSGILHSAGHILWILFGPGTWGSGGNMVAWVICGALGLGWLHAKEKARHLAKMTQAAAHHKDQMALMAKQHQEQMELLRKQHSQMSDQVAGAAERVVPPAAAAKVRAAVAKAKQPPGGGM